MYITSIEMQNFRSFEHERIVFDDITVFVGENNTGKSTIMDAIKLVIGTPSWNDGLSRYDYHLHTSDDTPGDTGEIVIKAEMSEEKEDEWADEIQQTLPDSIDIDEEGLRHFYLVLKGVYDRGFSKSTQTREFQNKNGESKGAKANNNQTFNRLRSFLPIFQINSIRDFEAEFQQKRGLFRKFLNSDKINPEKKVELETKLVELNREIIDILKNIKLLKDNLTKSMTVLSGTDESIIDIESVPTNLDSLIEKAGIVLQNATGIKLPLERHGSGALSLAVIFLYEAYLSVLVADEFDKFATPILLIEEPEAHLHPSAIRLFWHFLEKMPGQKIISTHSGDIISNVPISKIRRIVGISGLSRVKSITDESLDKKERRSLRNYITYNRGELLFAKKWLLVEGETEQTFFETLFNHDGFLDSKGIRIFQITHIGISTLLKLASQLYIKWFLITDGDKAGQEYKQKAVGVLPAGSNPDEYIFSFSEITIEVFLMANGFSSYYESQLSQQTKARIQGNCGTLEYYNSVYHVLPGKYKIPIICEIIDAIEQDVSKTPALILELKSKLTNIVG
jgi:putative ATP-dependent endonuclease of OLD family